MTTTFWSSPHSGDFWTHRLRGHNLSVRGTYRGKKKPPSTRWTWCVADSKGNVVAEDTAPTRQLGQRWAELLTPRVNT